MSFATRSLSTSQRRNRIIHALPWLVCLSLVACLPAADAPSPHVEKPAEEAPPARPERVGEGVISTAAPEFATTVARGGDTVYFNRATDDRSRLDLFVAHRADGQWNAEQVAFAAGFRDLDPFLVGDGSRLYFSSDRPADGGAEARDFNLWIVEKVGESWGEPVALGPPVNTESTEIYSTLTEGGVLYFSSDRSGEDAIYRAPPADGGFGEPEVVAAGGLPIAGGNPCIAPDESFLIFSAEREGGHGSSDLYITYRRDGEWSAERNLGEGVNSAFADFAPVIDPAGRTLYFTSERPGVVPAGGVSGRPPGDIYRIELSAIPSIE